MYTRKHNDIINNNITGANTVSGIFSGHKSWNIATTEDKRLALVLADYKVLKHPNRTINSKTSNNTAIFFCTIY